MGIANRKQQKQQIGVSKQQDNLYFVWLDELHKVQSICLNTQQKDIFSQLLPHLPQKNSQCCFVGAISPHLTWSKTLILPQTLNAQECEQQCRFILQKELPIPLDELWFDYLTMPLKQGFRLDITAIRKESANAELAKYLPLKLTALDLLNHSILRAFYAKSRLTPYFYIKINKDVSPFVNAYNNDKFYNLKVIYPNFINNLSNAFPKR